MKTSIVSCLVVCGMIAMLAGCEEPDTENEIVAEGVIYYVEYTLADGKTGGFTRLNLAEAVPGGNGSWNIDAYGRLTREYLLITRPQRKDLGVRVIPAHRLLDIQFGHGGLVEVNENQPAPPQ